MKRSHRGRRWYAIASTAAVLAIGTAMLGAGAANAETRVPAADNPPLPESCGIDVGIVLDLSNSLSDANVQQSKDAAKSVVDALAGTPSSVGVSTFATYGPDGTNPSIAKSALSTAQATDALKSDIDSIGRVPQNVGGTNWDRGLGQVSGTDYDVVLFVTDGKPTAYGEPETGSDNSDFGTVTDQIDIDRGVESANALKAGGTRVVGIAVGDGIDVENIVDVSGPQAGSDYYLTDFSDLADSLKDAALENCRGSVIVQKLVDDGDGDPRPASGWEFASPAALGETEGTTDEGGFVTFAYDTPADGVTVTETQQDGYRLQPSDGSNAVCTTADGEPVETSNVEDGFALVGTLAIDDVVKCRVVNEIIPSGFELTKESDPATGSEVHPGDTVTYTVTGENTGDTDLVVDLSDDLSDVLAHAEYNADAAAEVAGAPAGEPRFSEEDETLAWSGDVPAGESVEMTYSITIDGDAWGQTLRNVVTGDATPPTGEKITPPPVTTEHKVPEPPTEPEEPTEPEAPTEPTVPDEPIEPTGDRPEASTEDPAAENDELAVTGLGAGVFVMGGAGLLLAAAGAAALALKHRRQH